MACKHFQQEIHDFIKHAKSHPVTYRKRKCLYSKIRYAMHKTFEHGAY